MGERYSIHQVHIHVHVHVVFAKMIHGKSVNTCIIDCVVKCTCVYNIKVLLNLVEAIRRGTHSIITSLLGFDLANLFPISIPTTCISCILATCV